MVVGMNRVLRSQRAAGELDALLAITSLALMFVWVPLPVCQMRRGNSESSLPSLTSRAASAISSDRVLSIFPRSAFVRADASLRMPIARNSGLGIVSSPIGK